MAGSAARPRHCLPRGRHARALDGFAESGFDAVISIDNALPHLASDEELLRASRRIRDKLRAKYWAQTELVTL